MRESEQSAARQPTVAVSVENVDVSYRVYHESFDTERRTAERKIRARQSVTVKAIRGLSCEIGVGEAVGLIGGNGSGKSTLMRAIAGLQTPDAGRIRVRGEATLLGVGAALKPTLSGYRNVILGGLALGMERNEIDSQISEIAAFSGLREALGRPLRTYSSGMRARLAFSIATLRVPEVLLIDEALSVGDRQFRERSLERLRQIRNDAGTVIMVTHNLGEIRTTCDRAIWIEDGQIRATGSPPEIIDAYRATESK